MCLPEANILYRLNSSLYIISFASRVWKFAPRLNVMNKLDVLKDKLRIEARNAEMRNPEERVRYGLPVLAI